MSTDVANKKRGLRYEKGLNRPKDPNAPKKPLTAYFLFAGENRESVQSQNASAGLGEITKKLGEMWRSLPDEEKAQWEDKAKVDMEAYNKEFALYKKTSDHENFVKSLQEYQIKMTYKPYDKDENAPKRPQTGYFVFMNEERSKISDEHPDMKNTQVIIEVGKRWKNLGEEGKKPYNDRASENSEKYKKEVEAYKETEEYKKYQAEKEAYQLRMAAKRRRLMKKAGMIVPSTKGSGATPNAKRKKKSDPKKKKSAKKSSAKKSDKKKTSAGKKKKSDKKKKKSADKKKKSDKKKKGSTKKSDKSSKKKVSKNKKKSANKKARKAKRGANSKSKK